MAKLSSDGKSVTVERGDTLSEIAQKYAGGASKYKQLAAINNIPNPNLIYVGQVIKLVSTGGSTQSSTTSSNKPTINQFGLMSNDDGTLFATWSWGKKNTESYKVVWTYDTGNGVWFSGNTSTITVESDTPELARQSTFSIPSNATKVKFKVKPIAKTYKKNNKDVKYWEASWSDVKTYTDSTPLETPPAPSVELDKFKLTATLDNLDLDATGIEFEIVKDNAAKSYKAGKATIVTRHASYSCTVEAGSEYKVRCRAYKGSVYSDWSDYSANIGTMPATPAGITSIKATSETSVRLEWAASVTATSYDIEYATKKTYFDNTDATSIKSGIEFTTFELTGLTAGEEYFFRVRATNNDGSSAWSEIKSVAVGKKPVAPTTWSSTTTAIVGEPLNLYWIHNAEDGSSQTFAELELTIAGEKETHTIENTRSEEDKDKTSVYAIDTSKYVEGVKIQWRVRTAGVTKTYGDWSVQRTIDIYTPPTLDLDITDSHGNSIRVVGGFPLYISALPGPKTQAPIGYHLTITANEMYETSDNVGNSKTINTGDEVYSRYFDTKEDLLVELSAGSVNLENNIEYTVTCIASMNSGLTANGSVNFVVGWIPADYEPNAEIGVDEDTYTASIRPYCQIERVKFHRVIFEDGVYSLAEELTESVWGSTMPNIWTTTGERVYSGTSESDEDLYFAEVSTLTPVTDVLLSVYRREFDGSFTEIASGLDGAKSTTVTDPHPSLDYARYRIVAISKETGLVSFYDPPGIPVQGKAIIIQWDESWTSFETTEEAELTQPPWSGSLLRLPYNVDVADGLRPDVAFVEYIGREHPVSYYGTQLGETSSWNTVVEKDDKETVYTLRRLARWTGDVYVREPSGIGYWANVNVSMNQKHKDPTIPVTLDITRVEGGV